MKTPKIRFKGFTEDWEQRKASEMCSISTGKSNTQDKIDDGEYPFYVRSPIIEHSTKYLYDEEAVLTVGDGVGTGKVFHYVNGKYDLHQRAYRMFDFKNDVDAKYFYYYFSQNFYKRVMAMTAKTSVDSVRYEMIADMNFMVPDFEEQKAISSYLWNLDHLITLRQRKCDEAKKLKKFMLQKMFPQGDSRIPEIRFAGFTGDWEQRKLIDVCDYVDYRGKTPTKVDDGIFLVTAKNVKDGYIDYESSKEYISEKDYEEVMHRGLPQVGDVLITTEAPCGNVAQVNREDIALAQRVIKYRGKSRVIDNTYLKHYMLAPKFQGILSAKSSGGTVKGIKGSILHQQYVELPSYAEQLKIGQYMEQLSNLITLHQRKCDELQRMKKFMLQNMFV